MLLFDIGPVYIKAAMVFKENETFINNFCDIIKKNSEELDIFNPNLTITFKNYNLFFFKINLFRLEEFKSCKGLEIVKNIKN